MRGKTVLISVSLLIIGLVAGYFLYNPINDRTSLHAGGVITNPSQGIWTGVEYAKPWYWTPTQWTTFVTCLGTLQTTANSTYWSNCAANAIRSYSYNSTMVGMKKITLSTLGRESIGIISANISLTGTISGTYSNLVAATNPLTLPNGTLVSGYINPEGQLNLQIGKSNLRGYIFDNGIGKTGTETFTGELLDKDGLQTVPGLSLLHVPPYITTTSTPAAQIPPGVSIYSVDLF